jgi:Rrf2 family protein
MAKEPEGRHSARDIATQYNVPVALLMNVLKQLAQANLIQSSRGPRGGYALAKSADDISIVDIIQAIEGPLHLVICASVYNNDRPADSKKSCDIMGGCPVGPAIRNLDNKLVEFLGHIKLSNVLDGGKSLELSEAELSFADTSGE